VCECKQTRNRSSHEHVADKQTKNGLTESRPVRMSRSKCEQLGEAAAHMNETRADKQAYRNYSFSDGSSHIYYLFVASLYIKISHIKKTMEFVKKGYLTFLCCMIGTFSPFI
jgi:hypothetical protein